MKLVLLLVLSLAALSAAIEGNIQEVHPEHELATNLWAVELKEGADPDEVAFEHGFINMGQVGELEHTFLFHKHVEIEAPKKRVVIPDEHHSHLSTSPHVLWFENQVSKKRFVRWETPSDPLYANQWHLKDINGVDVNAEGAWKLGYTGAGVTVAVVDDGLQRTHPDIASNYNATGSYDFNEGDGDPSPHAGDDHGTSAGGVCGAGRDNGVCGVGAAYNAMLSGIRLIADYTTDAQEASGLSYRKDINSIYTNSWGPNDDGKRLEGPGRLTLTAMENSISTGRQGKGSIYVWAGGNGRTKGDDCNYDGYANSRFTIAIGAVDYQGKVSYYSESCAALLACTPSSGPPRSITTTDLLGSAGSSSGDCTASFGGTSAAAPLAAGVIALMLQANPNLGWRDVQDILANTSRITDPSDEDWTVNGAGYHHNHKYGFGLIDAEAAVSSARVHTNLPTYKNRISNPINVNKALNDNSLVDSSYAVNVDLSVETVEIVVSVTHPSRGELEIYLTSPAGTKSVLQDSHTDRTANINSWTYSTVRSWGEGARGTWKLTITDKKTSNTGTWNSWELKIYGH